MTPTEPAHIPVLAQEALEYLSPQPGHTVVDCTVGLGGHAALLAQRVGSHGRLIGLDRDTDILAVARANLADCPCFTRLVHANFAELPTVLANVGVERADVILADIGINSAQLDDPQRGFSFAADGPLDMRMDPTSRTTAADLIAELPEAELADLIWRLGEERGSRRIARHICTVRRQAPLTRTGQLADAVCQALRVDPARRRSKIHPATRTFQAIRIAVNGELSALESLLAAVPICLNPGGRVGIISFHSLEDRLVKYDFRGKSSDGIYEILTRRPVQAGDKEKQRNPRARSAKLRVAKRTQQPMK